MTRALLGGLCAAALSGCATLSQPVPADYKGPTATVVDSIQIRQGEPCGQWYFLSAYDGKDVDNALEASVRANAGMGLIMSKRATEPFSRAVPAASATFHITGRTHCAAPIMELGTIYLIHGNVVFAPDPGGTYVIKGELTADHGAVWIEDQHSGAQMGNKLLIQGEPKSGFFDQKGPVIEVPPPKQAPAASASPGPT